MNSENANRRMLLSAGILMGIGLGGFADGIVLHQILQWHHMLSSRVDTNDIVGLKYNMVWDGLFHAFTWIMTAVGLAMLWRGMQKKPTTWSTRQLVGSLLLGNGLFNFVEGLIDHHLLDLHHVHPGEDQLAWDLGFLVLGALMITAGRAMIRSDEAGSLPAR